MDNAVEAYILALSKKDAPALTATLTPTARFRGFTPDDAWEARTPGEITKILFGSWFEPHDEIVSLVSYDTHDLPGRIAFIYRIRGRNPSGDFIVEQQGYASLSEDGKIADITVVCSGFRSEA